MRPHHGTHTKKNHIERLNKIQRRAARFCCNDYRYTTSVSGLINQLGWPSLEARRSTARLAELYKITHGMSPVDGTNMLNKPHRNSRANSSGSTFINLSSRIDCFKYSFFPRTICEWNNLSPDLRSKPTLDSFKHSLSSCWKMSWNGLKSVNPP